MKPIKTTLDICKVDKIIEYVGNGLSLIYFKNKLNPRFIINDDKTIVCIISDSDVYKINKRLIRGVARLHDGDTYDVEVGKKIAFDKAFNKYKAIKMKKTMKMVTELNSLVDEIKNWEIK